MNVTTSPASSAFIVIASSFPAHLSIFACVEFKISPQRRQSIDFSSPASLARAFTSFTMKSNQTKCFPPHHPFSNPSARSHRVASPRIREHRPPRIAHAPPNARARDPLRDISDHAPCSRDSSPSSAVDRIGSARIHPCANAATRGSRGTNPSPGA